MSEFRQLIITNKGQALMAKLIAGTANVTFTIMPLIIQKRRRKLDIKLVHM